MLKFPLYRPKYQSFCQNWGMVQIGFGVLAIKLYQLTPNLNAGQYNIRKWVKDRHTSLLHMKQGSEDIYFMLDSRMQMKGSK